MSSSVPTVINAKAIEKQLKLYEARLAVLQEEVSGLERLRDACQLLLGTTVAATEVASSEPVENKARKSKGSKSEEGSDLVQRVGDLLRERSEGLTLDAIVSDLKDSGFSLAEGEEESTVESALKRNPELFVCGEGERWIPAASLESH